MQQMSQSEIESTLIRRGGTGLDKLAFISTTLLVGERTTIYQPAPLAPQARDAITSLYRMHYSLFFLADVEPDVHAPVREWLQYHSLVHAPTSAPYEEDAGTME